MGKKRGWFFRILFSYLLLAAVLLVVVGTLVSRNIRTMVSVEVTDNLERALHSVGTVFEDWRRDMEEYALQIKNEARMSPYALQADGYAALQAVKELNKTVAYSNLYESIAIVYAPRNFSSPPCVYASGFASEAQRFFSDQYRYDQWDLQALYSEMPDLVRPVLRTPEWITVKRAARGQYLTYIVPLCAAITVNQRGVMLFLVPVARFERMLCGVNLPAGATLVMTDAEGQVVFTSGSLRVPDDTYLPALLPDQTSTALTIDREPCQLQQIAVGDGQWRFGLLLPEQAVSDVMQTRMKNILFILGVGVLAAIGASFALSQLVFRPVKRLTGLAHAIGKDADSQGSEFEQIARTLTGLSQTNADLVTRLHSQNGSLRQHMLRSMCLENMEQKERFLSLLAEDGIPFEEAALRMVVLRIDQEERLKAHMDNALYVLTRYSLLKILRETAHVCGMTCVGCEIGVDNSLVAVLSGSVGAEQPLQSTLEQVQQVAAEHFDCTLTIGVSVCFSGLENTAAACRQAMEAAERRFLAGCGRIFLATKESERKQSDEVRRRLMRLEARVTGALREEKYGEAMDQLDQYVQAIRELRLSPSLARHQFLLLRSAVYQQLHLLGADTSAVDWMPNQQYETLDAMRDAVAKVLWNLEAKRKSAEEMQHSELIERCIAYMQEHVPDISLTMDGLAEAMGISAGYLSRCFKAQMGISPWQYFDGLRMRRACELLKETQLRIQDILESCGYVDKTNFMRKFKNQYGMTPMEYRRAGGNAANGEPFADDDEEEK